MFRTVDLRNSGPELENLVKQ